METVYEVQIGLDRSRVWACKTKAKADEIADKISKAGMGVPQITIIEYDPRNPFAILVTRGKFVETEEAMGTTNWLLTCRMYV